MSTNVEKTTKSDRRLAKKQARARQVLLLNGVDVSQTSTNSVVVYNAGLDNGTTREEVYALCSDYGQVTEIIMLPKKPYTFVSFSAITEAVSAQTELNGKKTAASCKEGASIGSTLHTFYVNSVPQTTAPAGALPPGLLLVPDFISEEYEAQLVAAIDWGNANIKVEQELKHRRVKHFGYEFKYSVNNVDVNSPLPIGIPAACDCLIDAARQRGLIQHVPDQLTVNQYWPGQGIPPHVDTPAAFEDGLISLSLGSQVVMDFRHPDGRQSSVLLPRRSLLVMTGESRYVWSHGITPRKTDIVTSPDGCLTLATRGIRTSFTFRKIVVDQDKKMEKLRQKNIFSRGEVSGERCPVSNVEAARLETQHVHQVYEDIASHFSETRHSAWPRIAEFVRSLPPGTLLADIGCGNGKYLGINRHICEVGADRSENLVGICRSRGHEAVVGDVLSVPLKSDLLDACLCIAVIHHLSTQERRKNAIQELVRVLRPGGQLLIYVWAMEQERNNVKSKYISKEREKTSVDETMCSEQCHSGETIGGACHQLQPLNSLSSDSTVPVDGATGDKAHCEGAGTKVEGSEIDSASNVSTDTPTNCITVHHNRTQFIQQDLLVPWQLKPPKENKAIRCGEVQAAHSPSRSTQTFHRYYHVFKEGELEMLCNGLPNVKICKKYYDQGNWCVLLQKKT